MKEDNPVNKISREIIIFMGWANLSCLG